MMCAKPEFGAGHLLAELARYARHSEFKPGDAVDLGPLYFGKSTICALLFTHPSEEPVHLDFLGRRYGLLLCIGITSVELAFIQTSGSPSLLRLLKEHAVFPYTTPGRPSVPLPRN